uniref:Uncharacterized protein n=1 Tax=Staphylococcus phage 184DA TaxID=3110532 RepID=A0AAU6MXB6_9CAUD
MNINKPYNINCFKVTLYNISQFLLLFHNI